MKYHGKYCGPNWSNGKHQLSVAYGDEATDALDQLCKEHDAVYATSTDTARLQEADFAFAVKAMKLGWPKSLLAGIAVGGQGVLRALDKIYQQTMVSQAQKAHTTFVKNAAAYEKAQKALSLRGPPPSLKGGTTTQSTTKNIPAAYSITSRTAKPTSNGMKGGGVVLSHRGLVSSFTGSTTFGAVNFQVNPGLGGVFPWCSQLARSYDKYRFRKLKFEFRSVVPTTTAGVVMMSFDYDTLDTLPVTKFEHAQTTPNVESNSFNSFTLNVECDKVQRFVRQGAVVGTDLKTYDFGQLVVSSSYGVAALVGEIYVDYEVELHKPSHGVPVSVRLSGVGANATPFTTSTAAGGAQPMFVLSTTEVKVLRPGEYLIDAYIIGTVITGYAAPTFVGTAAAGSSIRTVVAETINAAATVATILFAVTAGAGDVLTFASRATATTVTNTILRITEAQGTSM